MLLDYRGVRFHVFGPLIVSRAVDPELLRREIAHAATASDAVREIAWLHYTHGYPATLVSYAVADGQDVYVRVIPGRVSAVRGPAALASYFSDLPRRPVLRTPQLEADRSLADGLSERRGENYRSSFVPDGADSVVLDLGAASPGEDRTVAVADFSNYGNRYSGPYLAQAALRQAFGSGDELTLAGGSAVRFLGLGSDQSEPYHEGDLGWTRITPYGVFGLQGRYADFRVAIPGTQLGGDLANGGLNWLLPLYADLQRRFNLQARVERSYEAIDAPRSGDKALSEAYNSFEAGLSYTQRAEGEAGRFEWRAALDLRKGLSRDYSADSRADLGYFLIRPAFSVRYEPSPHWGFDGQGKAQLGGSSVPQLEQFVIGGPSSLHAYETGVGIGDRGEDFRIGADWKDIGDSWIARYRLQPAIFVEYGSTTLGQKSVGENSGRVALADAGVEVSLRLTHWLGAKLSAAQPFYKHGGDNSPDGLTRKSVFFDLAARF